MPVSNHQEGPDAFMPYIIYETARTGVTEEPRLAPVPVSIGNEGGKMSCGGQRPARRPHRREVLASSRFAQP